MTYAATYHIGYNSATQRAKAKATAPTAKPVRKLDAAHKGCRRNPKGQTAVRTDSHVTNGFLRTSFLPKLVLAKNVQACRKPAKTERDFYQSLSRLAEHYHIQPMQTQSYGYPYNIALSVWEVENHLKRNVRNWNCLRLVRDDKEKTFLISEEQYNTGATLYYIPVMPLYKMLRNKTTKRVAPLLLSVFAYLYHIVDIPYYRQQGAYIYWQYEMISDWIEQDEDAEWDSHREELKLAQWCGDKIERKIFNRKNLDVFQARIKTCKPRTNFERECLNIAKKAFALYTDYPATSVFQHAGYADGETEPDDEVIAMNMYISFIADNNGRLYETLAEMVNNEFNEYGITEEPTIEKKFNGATITGCNFDFERRLFPLIDDLYCLLNNY